MSRLQQHYREKVVPQLTEKFGYKSPMQVPRLTKITPVSYTHLTLPTNREV